MPMDLMKEVLINLRLITHAADSYSSRLKKETGLTSPQILVMQGIHEQGEICSGRLTPIIHLTQPTITSILDRLEQKGLVRRKRSDLDKRKVLVSLTEEGEEILRQAPPLLHGGFVSQWEKLTAFEQESLLISIKKIASMLTDDKD